MRATLSIPFIGSRLGIVQQAVMVEWLFRIGVAMCFVGHGAFGVITKEAWLPYFGLVGIGPDAAYLMMPLVGAMDITLGMIALVSPRRVVLLYMVIWTTWTAALRPLTGESVWELIERAGNYGVPLAFLLAVGWGSGRRLFERVRGKDLARMDLGVVVPVLRLATILLLLGHGMLAVTGANGIVQTHLTAIGMAPDIAMLVGGFEIGVATALAFQATPAFLVGVAVWKLATEMMFLAVGAPFWEVIERGGSYTAPLILALLLTVNTATTSSRGANTV